MTFFRGRSTRLLSIGAPGCCRKSDKTEPNSGLGRAISYLLNHWPKLMLCQLCLHPLMQPFHQRSAVLLMEAQPVFPRQFLIPGQRVVVINGGGDKPVHTRIRACELLAQGDN